MVASRPDKLMNTKKKETLGEKIRNIFLKFRLNFYVPGSERTKLPLKEKYD